MTDWYPLSIAALLLLGGQRFLYKVAAERNCSSALTTVVFMGTVTVLSTIAFFVSGEDAGDLQALVVLSLANSFAFALATVAHMEALRHLPAAVTFPLTRLSLVAVILFSCLFLQERLSPQQWGGILAGLAVVGVLAGERAGETRPGANRQKGFFFIALCVFGGAVAAISSKFAAIGTGKSAFMALSYLLATMFSIVINRKWGHRPTAPAEVGTVWIGVTMGLLNFFGFYAFLSALSVGPLSAIALLTGMHFVIAIALSAILYHERVTARRLIGIFLTMLAVYLLRNR